MGTSDERFLVAIDRAAGGIKWKKTTQNISGNGITFDEAFVSETCIQEVVKATAPSMEDQVAGILQDVEPEVCDGWYHWTVIFSIFEDDVKDGAASLEIYWMNDVFCKFYH